MFEVAEPPPKHGIEVGDDPPQTHTSASFRLGAHLVLERFQAFLAHEPKTALEPITDRKSTRLNSSHTEIYTLSLHDALPISPNSHLGFVSSWRAPCP